MATLLTLTITDAGVQEGETRKSERVFLERMLIKIANKLGSGVANSDAHVLDDNHADVGSWTYTPIASA
jgi:hypothetical protein